jgi:hypothetical protein
VALQLNLLPSASSRRVPTFAQTISALGNMPAISYRALEFGRAPNRTFFETLSQKERPRPHVREIIVRDQAKRFLERNDFQVDEESVTVGNEPLSALVVRCGIIQIRVLKGAGGIVPGCGESFRRRHFYNQRPDLYIDRKGQTRQTRLNLLALWDFNTVFNLDKIWLVCPMRAGETSADVLWHWHEPIPHPATTASPAPDEARRQAEEALREQAEEELKRLLRDDELETDKSIEKA